MQSRERRIFIAKLFTRDGDACFYCGLPVGLHPTLEHLLARSRGGPDTLPNLALAHVKCNRLADDRPLVDKIILRDLMRARVQSEKDQS